MLPLCLRLPLLPAQAPLSLLSPASGNAKRARGARTQGTRPARAAATAWAPEHWCSGVLALAEVLHFPEALLSAAGDTPRPLPLLFSLLSGSRDSSPSPPSPRAFSLPSSEARNP